MKKIFQFLWRRERFREGAAILSVTTLGSYITGLLRDRIFAQTFGISRELDIYNAAFIVPDLLFNVLVASGLSAAFVPVFTGLRAENREKEANTLANSVLHAALGLIFISGILALIFMPSLAEFLAPGFQGTERESFVALSRLMLISPILMTISNTFGSMLLSFKTFLPYGLSPIFYNLGIIAGSFTVPWFGLKGLVYGTLFGAMLHALPRTIAIVKLPFRYEFFVKFRDANFLKVVKLMIPKMFGHPVEQLTFLGFTRIATLLAAGSVTAISFARNFQSVAVSLFGIAFSVAIFPALSEFGAKGDRESFTKNFWKVFCDILIFTVPCSIGLYFLSDLPIRIFLGGGRFDDESILRTASVLSIFALSIPTESLVHLIARSFYALKNTITPVVFSIVGLVIAVSFAYTKHETLGIKAIPWGFFLGSALEVVLLGLFLKRKLRFLRC